MSLLFNVESFAVSFVRGAFLVLLIMYEGSYTLLSNRLEGAFLRALHYIDVVLAALLI